MLHDSLSLVRPPLASPSLRARRGDLPRGSVGCAARPPGLAKPFASFATLVSGKYRIHPRQHLLDIGSRPIGPSAGCRRLRGRGIAPHTS